MKKDKIISFSVYFFNVMICDMVYKYLLTILTVIGSHIFKLLFIIIKNNLKI